MTAEAALVLPLLAALTASLCWLLAVGLAQVRTVDAAREAARALARGDEVGRATALARRVAPDGAAVAVRRSGDEVVVEVSAVLDGPGGLLAMLPGARTDAEALAVLEPGAAP